MFCQRIGHGGASALARANTLASFDAACEIGVDMVEFDVRAWNGELVLAHTVLHARRGGNVPLDDALAHLRGRRDGAQRRRQARRLRAGADRIRAPRRRCSTGR